MPPQPPSDPAHNLGRTAVCLNYADPITQLGIVVVQEQDAVKVIVPPVRGVRAIFTWHLIAIIIFGVRTWGAIDERMIPTISPLILLFAAWHKIYTFWRRRVFLIDGQTVRFGYERIGRDMWEQTWPRGDIGEIKMNSYSGKLLIRITGKDMQEYFVSGRRDVTERVAQILQTCISGAVTR